MELVLSTAQRIWNRDGFSQSVGLAPAVQENPTEPGPKGAPLRSGTRPSPPEPREGQSGLPHPLGSFRAPDPDHKAGLELSHLSEGQDSFLHWQLGPTGLQPLRPARAPALSTVSP